MFNALEKNVTPTLRLVSQLINQGSSAHDIYQSLKLSGRKCWCFGSYYTVGSSADSRVYFTETDNGVVCGYVNR